MLAQQEWVTPVVNLARQGPAVGPETLCHSPPTAAEQAVARQLAGQLLAGAARVLPAVIDTHLLVPADVLVGDVVDKQLVEGALCQPELEGVEQHLTRTLQAGEAAGRQCACQ